jgi:hypothetical protein
MMIMPKNWAVFQHYKDRCPPWIKLHRDLLNNREYMRLPLASKALAPFLWLLASESKTGEFDASVEELCFRLHMTEAEVIAGLKPLIDKGFFTGASNVLADCNQLAIPETETEREAETKKKRLRSVDQTLQEWLDTLNGEPPIPRDSAVLKFATSAGIPFDYIKIAWVHFKQIMTAKQKTQKDWRQTFNLYVQKDYMRLWAFNQNNECYLTTAGKQVLNSLQSEAA